MFDLRYWFAYVVAIVVLEAWLIGRWMKLSWPKSLGVSTLANLVTGGLCSLGCIAPLLHQSFVGTRENPNPFLNAIILLTVFALPSAWVESIAWRLASKEKSELKHVGRVVFVHLITIPVGLAILLIPDRPYQGLRWARSLHVAIRAAERYVGEHEALPTATEPRSLANQLKPYTSKKDQDNLVLSLYRPDYSRFSSGESWKHPYEFNPAVLGKKIPAQNEQSEEKWVWWIRSPKDSTRWGRGIMVDLHSGSIRHSRDVSELEYKPY